MLLFLLVCDDSIISYRNDCRKASRLPEYKMQGFVVFYLPEHALTMAGDQTIIQEKRRGANESF